MAVSPAVKQAQARAAAAKRWERPDQADLQRDYATEKLADYIERVVAAAPPLTEAQRDRLAAILRGGRVA